MTTTFRRARTGLYIPPTAAGYTTAILADSPLAYYRLGEASGLTMVDSSGHGRNGAYRGIGEPTLGIAGLVTGDTDTAARFDGGINYGYAQTPYGSWMNVGTIGLEAIIKPTSLSATHSILDRDGYSGLRTFLFRLNGSKLELIFWTTAGGPYVCTGATTLTASTKYHVAATYDGANAKVYVDGVVDAALAQAGTLQTGNTTCPLTVGANYEPNSGPFNAPFEGVIDEPAMYASLSAARVAAHAALA